MGGGMGGAGFPFNMDYETLASHLRDVPTPADPRVVAALPRSTYITGGGAAEDEQNTCAVCQTEYAEGDRLVHLPCLHRYHDECVTPWLEGHKSCPIWCVFLGGLGFVFRCVCARASCLCSTVVFALTRSDFVSTLTPPPLANTPSPLQQARSVVNRPAPNVYACGDIPFPCLQNSTLVAFLSTLTPFFCKKLCAMQTIYMKEPTSASGAAATFSVKNDQVKKMYMLSPRVKSISSYPPPPTNHLLQRPPRQST
jgi:hypothetical protein